jgi:hypothetical protein
MHFSSLGLLAAAYQGAPENLFSLHSARTSPLYHTLSSCISLTMWTFLRAQHRSSSSFLILGDFLAPLATFTSTFPLWEIMVEQRGLLRHMASQILGSVEIWMDLSRGKACPSFLTPIAILSLYSTLFETCTWGGYWVRECYSSTADVFFVYVGLTPVCGEDRSSCELQNALCRRLAWLGPPSVGAPTWAL